MVAEQLIPFLAQPPPFPAHSQAEALARALSGNANPNQGQQQPDAVAVVQESYVLPIVHAFNGEPVVTDRGDIVYQFKVIKVHCIAVN